MEDKLSRRKFLGGAATAVAGTAALSGEAAARSIGQPVYTTDYIYIREQPDAHSPLIRTCNANTGLEIDDGPWYADGWKWWKYYVNGDGDDPGRVRGYGVEKYTQPAKFAYPTWGTVTSTYWDSRPWGYHKACDVANDSGTLIRASLGGTVSWAGWGDSYGYYIMIDHGGGWQTLYAHNREMYVTEGDTVARDQRIGEMGSTGDSSGPHCHFEIRKDGTKLNWPMQKNTGVWWGSGVEKW